MDLVRKEVAARTELSHQNISKYYGFCQNRKLKKEDGSETPVTYIVEEPILGGPILGGPILGGPILEYPITLTGEPILWKPTLGESIVGDPILGYLAEGNMA